MNSLCEYCGRGEVRERRRRFCSRRCAALSRHAKLRARGHRYARRIPDRAIQQAVDLVNSGATWRDAGIAIGMTEGALASRARGDGLAVRSGQQRARQPQRIAIPIEDAVLGYLAAIVDGEGHIHIEPRVVSIGVSNTDFRLHEWLIANVGGKVMSIKPGVRRPVGVWGLTGRLDCLAFLTAIEPFMIIKQEKAREAIALLNELLDPLA